MEIEVATVSGDFEAVGFLGFLRFRGLENIFSSRSERRNADSAK